MTTDAERFNAAVGAQIAAGRSSIAGMARHLGVARSTLDNYVKGIRDIPVPVAYEICARLGLSPADVVARAEERFITHGKDDELARRRRERVGARLEDEPSIKQPPAKQRTAARKGTRKADEIPYAE